MQDITNDRVGPMLNPPHLGELIRESMDEVGWNVTETATQLGCERGTLSRVLNGKTGVSASMALALEDIGWGTANHWMRMQASYEITQARRRSRPRDAMYQLEVKRYLVEHQFPPSDGWQVTVDVDAMERAEGGQHPPGKRERVRLAEEWLVDAGARIGAHSEFGRADVVAMKPGSATVVVEVEGDAARQKEQALYAAFGQVVLTMREDGSIRYGLAVPDTPPWERQVQKIPAHICSKLSLTLWLVGEARVRGLRERE